MDDLPGTDHDAFQFNLACNYSNTHHCQRLLYNYKKIDFAYFSTLLSHVPWHLVGYKDDMESSWNTYVEKINSLLQLMLLRIPKTKYKKHKIKHWFAPDTILFIHQKQKLYHVMKLHSTDLVVTKYNLPSNLVYFKPGRKDTRN